MECVGNGGERGPGQNIWRPMETQGFPHEFPVDISGNLWSPMWKPEIPQAAYRESAVCDGLRRALMNSARRLSRRSGAWAACENGGGPKIGSQVETWTNTCGLPLPKCRACGVVKDHPNLVTLLFLLCWVSRAFLGRPSILGAGETILGKQIISVCQVVL